MIDLHMHSHYSDGIYSPQDLVRKVQKAGFDFIALTDHNGIDGLEEFLTSVKVFGIRAISGVEFYTHFKNKHLHLLGYNFDIKDKELNSALKELQIAHLPQIKKAVKILQKDNWQITEKEVFNTVATYIGVGNLAGLLMKHSENWARIKKDFNWFPGKIISLTDVVGKYLFIKKSTSPYDNVSICPESEIPTERAIKLIKNAGGMAVLAHPGEQLSWRDDNLIVELKKMGLDGLEAISSHHSWQGMEHWQRVAKELDLTVTIGSDFHGDLPEEWGFPIRSQWEYFRCQADKFKNLKIL